MVRMNTSSLKIVTDPVKTAIAVNVSAFSFILGLSLLQIQQNGAGILFFCICGIFLAETVRNGRIILIDEKGIHRLLPGMKSMSITWEEMKELGVCGTKVFNLGNKNKTGRLYFYCSKRAMDDDEHFQMILQWPPKEQIYFSFSEKRLLFLENAAKRRIETYNTGNLHI